ncbi:hypothetical protein KIL84_003684 [Mauremys mutica]|uniref:Uncharacterized protein n=1 Tax=Mauremys mutica TaxID=74926 RepID=A0A9D3WUN0_9SAUR|nr:hypothetical protein KIL84_003684 [Mauremys mutica]
MAPWNLTPLRRLLTLRCTVRNGRAEPRGRGEAGAFLTRGWLHPFSLPSPLMGEAVGFFKMPLTVESPAQGILNKARRQLPSPDVQSPSLRCCCPNPALAA